jgi:CDP-6-deoxy-D-xylo-4-hexulose-3-dehydrase
VGDLVHTDQIMRGTLWLGAYPGLTADMLDWVAESVQAFCRGPHGKARG